MRGKKSAPAPHASPDEPPNPALTAAYEAMRAWATGQAGVEGRPPGLALVLQRGLPAWLAAWQSWVPPATPPAPPRDGPAPRLSVVRSELATVLVQMALAQCEEERR